MIPYPYTAEGRQPAVLAVSILFFLLTPGIVALRLCSRVFSGVGLWWDDWIVLLSLLFLLAFNSLQVWSITAGLGAVPSEKVLHNLEPFFKSFFADELLYDIALSLIKLSILLLYRRVFPTRQMNITVWVLGATVIGWFLGTGLAIIFQCHPIDKAWNHQAPGKCVPVSNFVLGQAVSSIVIDCAIFIAPVRSVFQLQMPMNRKFAVSGIFLLGFFAVACSVIRVPYALASPKEHNPDEILYTFVPGTLWTSAEMNMCLISACLPTLRYVISRITLKLFGKSWGGTSGQSRYQANGYRQTTSVASVSQKPKDLEGNSRLLSSNHAGIWKPQSHAVARASDNESEDIELGELSHFNNSRTMSRVIQGDSIAMRRDVQVYTST